MKIKCPYCRSVWIVPFPPAAGEMCHCTCGRSFVPKTSTKSTKKYKTITRGTTTKLKAHPDFRRNLTRLENYSKTRISLEKEKQFEKAVPFAAAVIYCRIVNLNHQVIRIYDESELKDSSYAMENIVDAGYRNALFRNLDKCGKRSTENEIICTMWKYYRQSDSASIYCRELISEIAGILKSTQSTIDPSTQKKKTSTKKAPAELIYHCPHCNQKYKGSPEYIEMTFDCNCCKKIFIMSPDK